MKIYMVQKEAERITRKRLRQMKHGEVLTVQCADGYDLESQKNTAYQMQKLERCKFTCKVDNLKLSVTRNDCD